MRTPTPDAPLLVECSNVTPPWLLIFLRLAGGQRGNYARAWIRLPASLPAAIRCPTFYEMVAVLAYHDLA